MKAFAYIRVSTDRQDLSPEVQRQQLAAYCAMKGYEIVPMSDEIGVSGSVAFEQRPVGAAMMERIGEVEAVVFSKLDRAFRDTIDCLMVVQKLTAFGKAVHFLDMGIDTTTPAGELCLTMMAAFARFERRRIAERIREALGRVKAQGRHVGPAPYGWKNSGAGQIERNDATLPMIMRIQLGRERGDSYRTIAERLQSDGIPTHRGGRWHPQTVANIVRRIEK